ncbi:MAG: aminoacyl-histidine dipeptidase, partial [Acutalibacteraceae bacterium]|nr:aminoacyl-histidine dipeptidase [Acutalibacteraceae bacterium]
MENLYNLLPKEVISKFIEISAIPHGSGNTKALSDYIVDFAQRNNYQYIQDSYNNIIIFADGTNGYENSETVILQGHIDMVCDKTKDCHINLDTTPITLCTDGKFIWADKTTLGGDDGIAVAYILALLDDKDIPHPPLEAIFTSDEEIGMIGARELDTSVLKGKRLINIDSEEEGVLTVSCAGGVRAKCTIPLVSSKAEGTGYLIKISGLKGGHSGVDINNNRTNANKLMAELLYFVYKNTSFRISSAKGGSKDNTIPTMCQCVICVDNSSKEYFKKTIDKFIRQITEDKKATEPQLSITIEECLLPQNCIDDKSTQTAIFSLLQVPDGVQTMSSDIPNMVQTSLNLGIFEIQNNSLFMQFFVRSNVFTGKLSLVLRLQSFFEYLGGKADFYSDYPAWEYRPDSPLRKIMTDTFIELYGYTPTVTAVHAGLECGILSAKIDNMDAVSFGPDIFDVHTPNEKIKVSSIGRCWEYLKAVLENCK